MEAIARRSASTTPSSNTIPSGRQHSAVPAHADGERVVGVRVEAVQELDGVGALDVDLAERRGVHHRRRPRARPRTREAPRPPCPRRRAGRSAAASTARRSRTPRRARRARSGSASRAPGRRAPRGCARRASAKETGHVRRPEGGRARARRDGRRAARRRSRIAFTFAVFPWSEPVPIGRVALDMLDGAQPGSERAPEVGDRRVALEVDEHHRLVAVGQPEGRASGRPSPVIPPAHSTPRSSPSGTGARSGRPSRSRPPAWLQRCTRGLQPPETARTAVDSVGRDTAPASITPGRSLSSKISGRSSAPVASTIRLRADVPEAAAALDASA